MARTPLLQLTAGPRRTLAIQRFQIRWFSLTAAVCQETALGFEGNSPVHRAFVIRRWNRCARARRQACCGAHRHRGAAIRALMEAA